MSTESEDKSKGSFWTTLPGILTGVAGMITAVGALVVAFSQAGLFSGKGDRPAPDPSQVSTPSESASTGQTSGSFSVYPRHSYKFTNPSAETRTIIFKASGEWLAIPKTESSPSGYVSPEGYLSKLCDSSCWCPQYVVGTLVASKTDQDCFEIGKESAVTLAGGQSPLLYMNDFRDAHTDNEGAITVEWSFAK